MIRGSMPDRMQSLKENVLISVIVVSYNHQRFIAQCLGGILAQKGDFKIELVVGDDFSTDGTSEIIQDYVDGMGDQDRIVVKFLPTDRNYGLVQNYKRCLDACTGDYFAICEGDDYWVDEYKLQKQMNFLKSHPNCSMCFNDIYLLFEDTGVIEPAAIQQQLKADIIKTRDLVLRNYIWNFSCCMYDRRYLHSLPVGLYELYFADWLFNICYSQHGDIGHIKELMSVYRKHNNSVWSKKSPAEADNELYPLIDQYNKLLNFDYNVEFSEYQKNLEENSIIIQKTDLAIIDNILQSPPATFRMWELKRYLDAFENARFYSLNNLYSEPNEATLYGNIIELKRKFPEHAHKIKNYHPNLINNAKIVYSSSLRNAYESINIAERLSVPFVFSFYIGDDLDISNHISNSMLKRIMSSPVFRKVIVTQTVTHDYLVNNQFCKTEQIECFLGMDNPLIQINDHEIARGLYEMQVLPRINLLKREIEQAGSDGKTLSRTLGISNLDAPYLKQHALNWTISLMWSIKRVSPLKIKKLIRKSLKAIMPQWLKNAIHEKFNDFRAL